ncbi:ash family protein [Yersinia enterocolitica]
MKNLLIQFGCWGYALSAPAKSGVGIGVPEFFKATPDAPASFLLSAHTHTLSMVGCMGASSEAPVSLKAGYANPVQSTTSEIGVSCGGVFIHFKEAANMATTPTQTHPQFPVISSMEVHHA